MTTRHTTRGPTRPQHQDPSHQAFTRPTHPRRVRGPRGRTQGIPLGPPTNADRDRQGGRGTGNIIRMLGDIYQHTPAVLSLHGRDHGGVSEKSDTVGGFEKPPPPLKMVRRGVLRVFFDAHTSFVRFFSGVVLLDCAFRVLSLLPMATFDFVPLARDPPQCRGDVAFPLFFWTFLILPPALKRQGIPEAAGVR